MRKIIFQMMISLDGFFEGPNRELDWHIVDAEFNEYAVDLLRQVGGLIFGRITYDIMVAYWTKPEVMQNDPIVAERMNNLPKTVFSRTLEKVDWKNTTLVRDNGIAFIRELKQQPGADLAILGSSDLSAELAPLGLIDEFRILISPVVLGSGNSLFKGIDHRLNLKLLSTRVFDSGTLLLVYGPDQQNADIHQR